MGKPYDLDEHVRRFLNRPRQPKGWRRGTEEAQMRLFDLPTPTMELNRPRQSSEGLIVDDEMLWSRLVKLHSAEKAVYARLYAEILGTAMRGKFPLWWIELFAGPGRLCVRETGVFVPGSPVDAVKIAHPFDGYVFADISMPCVESLRRRLSLQPNVHVRQGDANSADLLDWIVALVPRNALVVLYGDQEGLDLGWPTIKFFIDRFPHLDLLLNLPTEGVVRAVSAGYEAKASRILDHPAPHPLIPHDGPKGAYVREWYCRRLEAEGFDQIDGVTIRLRGRNRDLYDLMIASRNPLAPKFFRAAVESGARLRQRAVGE